jgi:hypothetical protein
MYDFPHLWHQWPWHWLVHVCQRWRSVIFASSKSNILNLKLSFEPLTHVELLDIWPPLPIVIRNFDHPRESDYNFDSVLMLRDRICAIHLRYSRIYKLERLVSAMQEQFPALTYLMLDYNPFHRPPAPALPVRFLGGHAPCLQALDLHSIVFPALPKLLLSATDLVRLTFRSVPRWSRACPRWPTSNRSLNLLTGSFRLCRICATARLRPSCLSSLAQNGSKFGGSNGQVNVDREQYLEYLRPFIAVETLFLSGRLVPFTMPILTEAVQAVTELLPAHRKLTLEEFPSFPRVVL